MKWLIAYLCALAVFLYVWAKLPREDDDEEQC